MELCTTQIATCIRGSTFTSTSTKYGNRAQSDTARKGEQELARFDAGNLGETLTRDLVRWVVQLNWPDEADLAPSLVLHVDEEPGPDEILTTAQKAVAIGVPVDADKLAHRTGLDVVPAPDDQPRACFVAKATTGPGQPDDETDGEGESPPGDKPSSGDGDAHDDTDDTDEPDDDEGDESDDETGD